MEVFQVGVWHGSWFKRNPSNSLCVIDYERVTQSIFGNGGSDRNQKNRQKSKGTNVEQLTEFDEWC